MHNRGFTLIDILISVATIGIIALLSVPVYQSFQVKTDVDAASETVVQTLRRAQALAQASSGDMNWGVYTQSGAITLFKGADYASRDAGFDEVFKVPTSITPAGVIEMVFDKFDGYPQTPGTITLASAVQTNDITVNEQGIIEVTINGTLTCGNGYIDAGEECDDMNTSDGDGCSSGCTIEWDFSGPFPTCHHPGTPGEQQMFLNPSSLPGHLGHGDFVGYCNP